MLKRLFKIHAAPLEIPRSTEFEFPLRRINLSATKNKFFCYGKCRFQLLEIYFRAAKKGEAWQWPDKIGMRRKTLHSSPFGCIYKKNK